MKIKLNNNELFIGKVFSYLHATGWNEIVLSITFWVGESGGVVESTRIFRVRDAYVFVIGNLNKECCDTPLPRLFLPDGVTHLFFSIYLFYFLSFITFLSIYILSYLFRIFYLLSLNSMLFNSKIWNLKAIFNFKNLFYTPMLFYLLFLYLFIYLFCLIHICKAKSLTILPRWEIGKIIFAIFWNYFDLATSCSFFFFLMLCHEIVERIYIHFIFHNQLIFFIFLKK